MFLKEQVENVVFAYDRVTQSLFCRDMLYMQQSREYLRKRFRSEYLGQLKLRKRQTLSRPFL